VNFDSDFVNRLIVGNIEYILLVLSMMMTSMIWLRSLAIASGVAGFVYSAWWLHDPVGMFWETAFTSVNVVQLLLIKYRNVTTRFSDLDRELYIRTFPDLEPYQMRRLLKTGKWITAPPATELTQQGQPVSHLYFLHSGYLEVLVNGVNVGVCDSKSLVGEISFARDQPATATVISRGEISYFAFEKSALRKLMQADPEIGRVVEGSLRRNLETTLIQRTTPATG
jgi:hypothetical protein